MKIAKLQQWRTLILYEKLLINCNGIKPCDGMNMRIVFKDKLQGGGLATAITKKSVNVKLIAAN
jgi:hypothetical protein